MNCHPLVKLAYMLHRVCIAVVNGEGWLLESPGERGSFNTASLVTLLLVGESLAWGGPGPLLVVVIIFVTERCVCAGGGGLSSLCKVQPSLQVIYLLLHGLFVILSLGHVITHTGMASAGLRRVYAPFLKPSVLLIPAMLRV